MANYSVVRSDAFPVTEYNKILLALNRAKWFFHRSTTWPGW